jgi:hypothetical protein
LYVLRLKPLAFALPADVVDPGVFAVLRMRAALSLGSSVVLNAAHVTMEK